MSVGSHLIFAVRTDFSISTWGATVEMARVYSPIWPACWVQRPDRSRRSSSQAVQNTWDAYIHEVSRDVSLLSVWLERWASFLAGLIGRFLPCRVGSHMSRLRHLGWEHCSHGLTSRPLESCQHQCLKAACGILMVQLRSFWMERSSSATTTQVLPNVLPLAFIKVRAWVW